MIGSRLSRRVLERGLGQHPLTVRRISRLGKLDNFVRRLLLSPSPHVQPVVINILEKSARGATTSVLIVEWWATEPVSAESLTVCLGRIRLSTKEEYLLSQMKKLKKL